MEAQELLGWVHDSQLASSFMLESEHLDNESIFLFDLGEKMKYGNLNQFLLFFFFVHKTQPMGPTLFFKFLELLV